MRRHNIPKPEKIAATKATDISLHRSRVYLLLVTSYTKNHAVKNVPIPKSIKVRCGRRIGFTGERYGIIKSIGICKDGNYKFVFSASNTLKVHENIDHVSYLLCPFSGCLNIIE